MNAGHGSRRRWPIGEQTVKRAAIDDPELKPLWDSMGGTTWKPAE
jgi:hypothetical protein